MLQQLELLPDALTAEEVSAHEPDLLIEETRQLFHHHGSDVELLHRVRQAIEAIHALCDQDEAE